MARATTTEPSRVYVGMLLLTVVAMLIGIVAMALEATEYDWVQKPGASPALNLPGAATAKAPAGGAMAPAPAPTNAVVETPKPAVAPVPSAVVEAPKPAEAPTVAPVPPTSVPTATPVAPPNGPIPSPFQLPRP